MADDPLARPIFVVAPPRAGARLVARALGATPGCWSARNTERGLLASFPALDPPDGSKDGRLTAADCAPRVREKLRARLQVDFAKRKRTATERPRLLHASPRNSLQVPFLTAAFPDAIFVYVHREPADAIAESLLVWRAGSTVTYPELPGWTGPAWSFLLVPGWRELSGRPLPEIVTEQWVRTMQALAGDLERLAPDRWCVVGHDDLRDGSQAERARLTRFLGLQEAAPAAEPLASTDLSSADLAVAQAELEPYLDRTRELGLRAADWLADS